MSQPNLVGRRISPRSLAGHERLPVRLSHVASANRYITWEAENRRILRRHILIVNLWSKLQYTVAWKCAAKKLSCIKEGKMDVG